MPFFLKKNPKKDKEKDQAPVVVVLGIQKSHVVEGLLEGLRVQGPEVRMFPKQSTILRGRSSLPPSQLPLDVVDTPDALMVDAAMLRKELHRTRNNILRNHQPDCFLLCLSNRADNSQWLPHTLQAAQEVFGAVFLQRALVVVICVGSDRPLSMEDLGAAERRLVGQCHGQWTRWSTGDPASSLQRLRGLLVHFLRRRVQDFRWDDGSSGEQQQQQQQEEQQQQQTDAKKDESTEGSEESDDYIHRSLTTGATAAATRAAAAARAGYLNHVVPPADNSRSSTQDESKEDSQGATGRVRGRRLKRGGWKPPPPPPSQVASGPTKPEENDKGSTESDDVTPDATAAARAPPPAAAVLNHVVPPVDNGRFLTQDQSNGDSQGATGGGEGGGRRLKKGGWKPPPPTPSPVARSPPTTIPEEREKEEEEEMKEKERSSSRNRRTGCRRSNSLKSDRPRMRPRRFRSEERLACTIVLNNSIVHNMQVGSNNAMYGSSVENQQVGPNNAMYGSRGEEQEQHQQEHQHESSEEKKGTPLRRCQSMSCLQGALGGLFPHSEWPLMHRSLSVILVGEAYFENAQFGSNNVIINQK